MPGPAPPIAVPPGAFPPPPIPPGPAPALPITSEHKTANDACKLRLRSLGMSPGVKIYPPPLPPGQAGAPIQVQTNVFGIEVYKEHEIFQYTVHIKADISPTKEVIFTKKEEKSNFVVTDRHEKCTSIFYYLLTKHDDFFHTADNTFVYDGQSVLFSTLDLFADLQEGARKSRYYTLTGSELNNEDLKSLPCIKFEVAATKNPRIKFSQEDIGRRSCDANIESVNRSYHQILELALNQNSVRDTSRVVVFEHGKMFFFKPLEEGYSKYDCVDVGDGKQMMPGIKKTVQFIEGPMGRGQNNPCVVIDAMKVAFHKEQPLNEKLNEVCSRILGDKFNEYDRERCVGVIKGLDVYTTYLGRRRHLKIEGLHHEGAETSRFRVSDSDKPTVKEYFFNKYGITLKHPKASLILCKERGQVNFFPMELLTVTPNQRVKISQQTSAQSQMTTKESAVLPDVRERLIMTGKAAAKIDNDNKTLSGLGVRVMEEPLVVPGRQMPMIKIAVNQTDAVHPQREGKWRFNQYTRPATPPRIWAMYCVGTPGTRFSIELLQKFGEEYAGMFWEKGVKMPPPVELGLQSTADIEPKLLAAAKSGCKFVFIITDDSITTLHQKYKFIENSTSMIIQDMKLSKAMSVLSQGKKLTLENVINKSNVKLGGTNYVFQDTKNQMDGSLIVGVGLSSPPPGTRFVLDSMHVLNPTIIGFTHNGKSSQEWTGDFVLSPAGQETLAPIEDIITECITGYQQWHDLQLPKRIIVYRSGASEGNHPNIMAYEVPLALSAIRNFKATIQLIYIMVSKDHTYRFFKPNLLAGIPSAPSATKTASASGSRSSIGGPGNARACDLNIGPGVMVDTGVTNPACKQFFLNSHVTLQGTAKTPLYSVLYDETGASMAKLEELTYSLCHLHQIVGLPTSLPTPLYVANEYAKRGRNLWNETCKKDPSIRQISDEGSQLRQLTDAINYKASGDLIDRRINA
uniref:PAZ domain-containing protein n=1 Tax=Caenorhabditis tropicalis TaxID=1561998 RepID=A0A1I7UVC8_9PELO